MPTPARTSPAPLLAPAGGGARPLGLDPFRPLPPPPLTTLRRLLWAREDAATLADGWLRSPRSPLTTSAPLCPCAAAVPAGWSERVASRLCLLAARRVPGHTTALCCEAGHVYRGMRDEVEDAEGAERWGERRGRASR